MHTCGNLTLWCIRNRSLDIGRVVRHDIQCLVRIVVPIYRLRGGFVMFGNEWLRSFGAFYCAHTVTVLIEMSGCDSLAPKNVLGALFDL